MIAWLKLFGHLPWFKALLPKDRQQFKPRYSRYYDLNLTTQINSGATMCIGIANRVLRRRPTYSVSQDLKEIQWSLVQLRTDLETGRDYMGYAAGHDDPARYTNDSTPTYRDAAGVLIERSYPIDFKWQDPRPYHNAPNSF